MLIVPISFIIATANRATVLKQMIDSLLAQDCLPKQLIFIDASEDNNSWRIISLLDVPEVEVIYETAEVKGAASQRNQGIKRASQPYIGFFDDDIIFKPDCLKFLFQGINDNNEIGGVNAFITNQYTQKLGKFSKIVYFILRENEMNNYDGKCFGPVVNLLPRDYGGEINLYKVDWLNTTCSIYRREALPNPVFDEHFIGYSFMEDLALSLRVGDKWKLFNIQNARIYHNSQPGLHKKNIQKLAEMELLNRFYVMTIILEKSSTKDYFKLFILEVFNFTTFFRSWKSLKEMPLFVLGKLCAVTKIIFKDK